MPNAKDFRRIVLGLPDAIESAHMGHPDFRVNGRRFATLNHDQTRGMVVLTPDQQEWFVRENASVFQAESGAWGRSGCTRVHLHSVDEETLGEAVTLAWQNSVAKGPARSKAKTSAKRAASTATAPKRGRQTRPR
ncbi:MAG: MmcQ/YjbR family DNA-binding protein [Luteitalea sp.]|nr:MmcQ/YjbR family DNA-binding protein [Luteitalea sp.]